MGLTDQMVKLIICDHTPHLECNNCQYHSESGLPKAIIKFYIQRLVSFQAKVVQVVAICFGLDPNIVGFEADQRGH